MTRKLLTLFLPLLLLIFVSSASAADTATVRFPPTTATGSAPTAIDAATKLKLQIQLIQDQKNAAMTKIKNDAKALIQAKRDEFKLRVQTIKDLNKKALVERIDAKLAEVNKNQTTGFTEVLVRLQGFLDKIKQSTPSATLSTNITAAQTAIDTAKAAVDAQAAKAYTMTIIDDATLKLNAGATVSQLRLDLTAVYKLVIDAKQAVQKLNTNKVEIKKEATKSAEL